jgi:hypothetical protein
MGDYTINYRIEPGNRAFSVDILMTQKVSNSMGAIKAQNQQYLINYDVTFLELYRIGRENEEPEPLHHRCILSAVFQLNAPLATDEFDHVLVRLPECESVNAALGGFPDNVLYIIVVPLAGSQLIQGSVVPSLSPLWQQVASLNAVRVLLWQRFTVSQSRWSNV